MNKRGPSAGRGENFGVNNFSNEWVFFSFLRVFIFIFFFSDGCCCKILDENGWSFFFHAHLLKSVETFTSKENGPRDRVQCAADGRIIQGVFFFYR